MDRKRIRYVVCEGPDDLGVLRSMLNERDGQNRCSGRKQSSIVYETEHVALRLEAAPNAKSGLASHVVDLAEGAAGERPDAIGVVFDPDADPIPREFFFFERDYNLISTGARRGTTLQATPEGYQVNINRRDVRILYGAWRANQPASFAGLPNDHCLERVLIGGILDSRPDALLATWALDSTTALAELVQDHGWKRAFRIWNAALEPKTESFADKLLEAPGTKAACLAAIRATPVAQLIQELLAA
jgi:hypothetical protein